MKKKIIGLLLVFGFSMLTACDRSYKSTIYIDETQDFILAEGYSDFEQSIDEIAKLKNFQGSLLIALKDEIIMAKGYGFANEETQILNTMNTTFEIGSLTKQFTAAAIMKLVEKGELSVDDTIDKYFPDYIYGKDITIKNLLQMRSGIYDYLNESQYFYQDQEFILNFTINMFEEEYDKSVFLENMYSSKLKFKPESKFSYSNSNYFLLGLIIEQITNLTYQEYITDYILRPCGMNTSNMNFKKTGAIGYSNEYGYYSYNPTITYSAGSICSNVIDMFKWDTALVNEEVVTEASFAEMIDAKDNYGYGIMKANNIIYHNGKTLCFGSYNKIDLDKKLTVIIMTNNVSYDFKSFCDSVNLYSAKLYNNMEQE